MKKLIYLIFIAVIFSCGKDGDIGPQGEKGEKGEKGIQGINGVDGSTLLYGIVDPKSTDGKMGDFYFNTSNTTMFGPKTTAGWGTGNKIKGEKGKDGVDGQPGGKILKGTVPPDTTMGDIGDYYFDINVGNFYGPKKLVETVGDDDIKHSYLDWGMAVSLRPTKPQNVKLYLMKPEFKNNITLNGLEVEAFSQKVSISEPWNCFLEFFYHVRQANVTYPNEIFLLNWNQFWTEPVQVEDIVLPSGKIIKNVKLTMIMEKPPGPHSGDYRLSFKLNATVPDTDTGEISGSLFDFMVRVYYYSL